MKPHQERVVAEKADLQNKIEKLHAFIKGDTFQNDVPEDEQVRLLRQLGVMQSYGDILQDRIDHFPK